MQVSFGGGHVDAILDLRSGRISIYGSGPTDDDGRQDCHRRLGGKQYYQSRTWYSGAGWLPDAPYLVRLGTVRRDATDWYDPGLPRHRAEEHYRGPEHPAEPFMGWRVWVPFNYGQGCSSLADEHPIVMIHESWSGNHRIVFAGDERSMMNVLRGDAETETIELGGVYFLAPGAPHELTRSVEIIGCVRRGRALYALEEIEGWLFRRPEVASAHDDQFWSRLGLHDGGDGYRYRLRRGRCTMCISDAEAADPAKLATVVPQNVMVLGPWLYLQGDTAVYRHSFSGEWYDYEIVISDVEFLDVCAGNAEAIEALRQRLEAGATRKHAADEGARVSQAEFEVAITQNAAVEMTVADSIAAGNCETGTIAFRDRNFPGRDSVTIEELKEHRNIAAVRLAIIHKIRSAA